MNAIKKIICVILCLVLVSALPLSAYSEIFLPQEDKAEYVGFFNDRVNRIKSEMPYAILTYTNQVPEGGIKNSSGLLSDDIDENAAKYLIPLLEGLFNNNSNMSQSFIKALFNEKVNPEKTLLLKKETPRDTRVPLYGEPVVSKLEPADDYDIVIVKETGSEYPESVTFKFDNKTLEEAKNGSLAKAFSLPDGTIDPVIIGSRDTGANSYLENVKFLDFNIANASVTAKFNKDGQAVSYYSVLDYKFSFTFYDVMLLLSAFTGYNFYTAVIGAMNVILANLGRDSIAADDVLKDKKLNITYTCAVELSKINWTDRCFGDADGDGFITASDARIVLREAVGLENITNAADLVMCDVTFDGKIDSEDSRAVLRTAVGLEDSFSEVPEGKQIQIADLDAMTVSGEKNTQTDPGGNGGNPGNPTPGNPSDETLNSIIQGIFDIINATKDIADTAKEEAEEFH